MFEEGLQILKYLSDSVKRRAADAVGVTDDVGKNIFVDAVVLSTAAPVARVDLFAVVASVAVAAAAADEIFSEKIAFLSIPSIVVADSNILFLSVLKVTLIQNYLEVNETCLLVAGFEIAPPTDSSSYFVDPVNVAVARSGMANLNSAWILL